MSPSRRYRLLAVLALLGALLLPLLAGWGGRALVTELLDEVVRTRAQGVTDSLLQEPGPRWDAVSDELLALLERARQQQGFTRVALFSSAGHRLAATPALPGPEELEPARIALLRHRSGELTRAEGGWFWPRRLEVLAPVYQQGRLQAILLAQQELDPADMPPPVRLAWMGLLTLAAMTGGAGLFLGLRAAGLWRQWRRSEERNAREDSCLAGLLRILPMPAYVKSVQGLYLDFNESFRQFFGRRREQILGRRAEDIAPPEMARIYDQADRELLAHGDDQHFGTEIHGGDNVNHSVVLHKRLVRDAAGAPVAIVGLYEDLTEKRAADERLRRLAYYDDITGLPNRALLLDRLQQALARARRDGTQVALLLIDLDHFKEINDRYGLAVGDQLLRFIAHRLGTVAGVNDTLARLGGDDFVLLMPDLAATRPVAERAESICRLLDTVADVGGLSLYLSASVGIALHPTDSADADGLFNNAEVAMYAAKQGGRNRFRFFTRSVDRNFQQRRELEYQLRQALERDQFYLDYQPQVDLRRGGIVGAEALLRWAHPERGVVLPDEFMAVAEETGLSGAIGSWVLRTACAQLRAWQQAGLPPLRLAVNISGRQFSDPDFIDVIDAVFTDTGLDPRWLELELTESLIMRAAEKNITALIDYKTRGISLVIDDFGTGYSSLARLRQLPIDGLKIDRSFVRDLGRDTDSATIIDAILAMSHSLGLRVTVEGVENREQLRYFEDLDDIAIQGFFFGRPLPADAFALRLRAGLDPQLLRPGLTGGVKTSQD